MSRLILCEKPVALTPYYVEEANLNIYSEEELCYYICHHLYTLENSFFTESLCSYLEHELGHKYLASQVRAGIQKQETESDLALILLKGIPYCSPEELHEAEKTIRKIAGQKEETRRKVKADSLMEQKRYKAAVEEYFMILCMEKKSEMGESFFGDILHNIGVAYAKLFLFDEAASYFEKAYEKNRDKESFTAYIGARRFIRSKEKYVQSFAEDNADDKEEVSVAMELEYLFERLIQEEEMSEMSMRVKGLMNLRKKGDEAGYFSEITDILQMWKDQYRNNVLQNT